MAPAAPWVLQSIVREAAIGSGLALIGGLVWYYSVTKPTADRMKLHYSEKKN